MHDYKQTTYLQSVLEELNNKAPPNKITITKDMVDTAWRAYAGYDIRADGDYSKAMQAALVAAMKSEGIDFGIE